MPVLTRGFRLMGDNAYVSENGDASNLGRSGKTFLFFALRVLSELARTEVV